MKRWLLLILPLLVLLVPAVPTQGQGGGRAGVVVRFGDGSVHTGCVSFAGDSISGLELLQRSGLDVIAQAAGNNAAVCKIGPDGCNFPAESCLGCKFGAGGQGEYWAYWQLAGGAWTYGQIGAGSQRIRSGDVDGWAYGPGNVPTGAQPPVVSFEQICSAPPDPPAPVPPTAAPPTAVPPTRVPPTAVPPTRVPPTVVAPTAVPPTVVPPPPVPPTTQPTPQAAGAAPAVVPSESPSPTASMTPTLPAASATPEPTATDVPTATTAPTATIEPTATATPTTEAATPTAEPVGAENGGVASQPNWTNYGWFVAMFALLLGGIGATVWRQHR